MTKRFSLGIMCAAIAFACSSPATDEDLAAVAAPAVLDGVLDGVPSVEPSEPSPLVAENPTAFDSALVVHVGDRAYLVLDAAPELAWAEGKPEVSAVEGEGFYAVTRPVADGHVPERARGTLGKRVSLFGAAGAVCEAVVDEVTLLGRVSPDGDTYSKWRGEARDEADHVLPATPRAEMADEAWTMAEGSIVLAATLRPIGRCAGASFALLGAETSRASNVATLRDADTTTTARALEAFRALPAYSTHATDYLAYAKDMPDAVTAPTWERHGESSPRVTSVRTATEKLVWVTANVDGGCGDFGAELSALFRETASGLEVVRVMDGFSRGLEGAVKTSDGYELVFPEAHVGPKETDEVERLEVRTFGCSC